MNCNFILWLIIILLILTYIMLNAKEGFSTNNSSITVLIFVSKSCGHCITYNNTTHATITDYASENNINLKRIFSDDDPDNLFDKYNIQYVPACIIIKENKTKTLNGQITHANIESAVQSM